MARVFNNCGLKLLSLGLAILLWAYVYLYINYPATQVLSLPLKIKGVAAGMVVASEQPKVESVQLRVRGPYRSIRQLSPSRYSAFIDCSTVTNPGVATLRVQIPDFADLTVTDQTPAFIDVELAERASKSFRVAISRRGEIDPGFIISSEELSRSSVQISGAASLIARIAEVEIQPNVEGLRESTRNDQEVVCVDSEGQPLSLDELEVQPPAVGYSLNVAPAGNTRLLNVVPVTSGNLPRDCVLTSIKAEPAAIPVEAGIVPPGSVAVQTSKVNLADRRESFTVQANLIYPFSLPASSILPKKCDVVVEIQHFAEEDQRTVRLDVALAGVNPDYQYIVTPSEVVLRSSGINLASSRIRKMLVAQVNVAGLEPGEYRLIPQVAMPLELEQARLIPGNVRVTVLQLRRSD
jgi:YbbR domain-containing protein